IDAFENDADDTMLPIPTHMTPEQAERELLYRTLLSLKRDVDDIKHFLVAKFGNVPRPLGGSDFPHAGYAPHFDKETRDGKIVETEVYNVDEGQERDSLSLSDLERDMIIKALKKFDGKRNAAARSLGLSERTLYRKIKEYNLDL
ncbi:MAG TPA: helix-turn-helix domain-containing protein, partial [bacterium]|nr:helix-turn-helix domain-containing protein [bacterium]